MSLISNSVVGIDPGPKQSGYAWFNGGPVTDCGIVANDVLLGWITDNYFGSADIVFEQVKAYGQTVGASVFETVFWTGRLFQAADSMPELRAVARMPRLDVKMHLCRSAKAGNTHIRAALLKRWGGIKTAKGTKASPGPLYGVTSHAWSALAIAVVWWDRSVSSGLKTCLLPVGSHSR